MPLEFRPLRPPTARHPNSTASYRLRLIARFRPQRADGGSYPYHWVIQRRSRRRGPRRAACALRPCPLERWRWTATRTLAHRLGANPFFIDLAHARTHPGAELRQWLPEAACQRSGTFALPDDAALVRVCQPRARPDGYGLWADAGQQVPFFLEHDTGSEQLSVLAGKLAGYHHLFAALGGQSGVALADLTGLAPR